MYVIRILQMESIFEEAGLLPWFSESYRNNNLFPKVFGS